MRRLVGMLAFAFLVVGSGGSSAGSVAVTPPKSSAALALVTTDSGSRLAWLDPATLRPLTRPTLSLPGGAWSPVFSPAGRYVALGGPGTVGVRVVDLRHMRLVASVAKRGSNRRATPLAWPERGRLLVLDSPLDPRSGPEALLAVDPFERRIVGRTVRASSARSWRSWAPAGRELVAVSQPTGEVGVLRIIVFGPGAGILRAGDVGIVAGVFPDHGAGGSAQARVQSPALAVDPSGRRAFVVDVQSIASVDLQTLDVSYARLTAPRSLGARLLDWLEPTAQAKLVFGYARSATWLGNEKLTVSGSAYQGARLSPSGLQVVDVRSGESTMLEPRASAHRLTQGVILAFGGRRDEASTRWTGMGLAAFAPDGTRLWSSLGDEPVGWVEAAAGYAYAPTPDEVFPSQVRVLDLATGAVIRTVRGEMPTFVARG